MQSGACAGLGACHAMSLTHTPPAAPDGSEIDAHRQLVESRRVDWFLFEWPPTGASKWIGEKL